MGDLQDKLFIEAAAISPEIAEVLARRKPPPPSLDPSAEDQEKLPLGLSRWGAQVAIGRGPCVIDPVTAEAILVTVPGLDHVLSVAGDDVRYAIGITEGELRLLREAGDGWQPMALPPHAPRSLVRSIRLSAHGDAVVICSARAGRAWFDWWTGERWLSGQGCGEVLLASSRRLWRTYSNGEWGGMLEAVSPPSAGDEPVFASAIRTELPVRTLAWDPEGVLLVGASGHAFGFGDIYIGAVAADAVLKPRFVAGTLGAAMALAGDRGGPDESEGMVERLNKARAWLSTFHPIWPHHRDGLISFDVGRRGELYLLTNTHGIFHIIGEELTALTPAWPPDLRVHDGALWVSGDTAVIASNHLGVLVCDLGGDAVPRRVRIP